ncbi:ImmA/IrrE family metallo-endopeptidase [Vitiosangium sp. GDMCC 1.1324]|uniref:ImmA/IrrE family metallo-endopeptidase n=1 Tax=Vitiosangium sp. (strain GDMCC 1.1324) TaxID=2138576 RepID=UPI000D38A9C5|nr:ImmA/IrrE family metallo-endopeptidase [Vitiosangium sp. GDMCC 1.1324]PTL82213.1 hypothetical protein DAT35_20710 [Vitiosangium sp. GDMCC 1.1324]
MTEWWLKEAVAACGLPLTLSFPRDPKQALLSLPVTLERMAHLSSEGVRDWLVRKGVHHKVTDNHRSLHGCMVAWRGVGVIFYDTEDDSDEQRFTLAHEVAHFVLEHLLPRSHALHALGEGIRPVLDGWRAPRSEELLSSVLEGVPLGLQVRLMERDPSGIRTGKVARSERRADRLALELLAPAERVLEVVKGAPEEVAVDRVVARFGLPRKEAREYVRMLSFRHGHSRFSIQELLGCAGGDHV